MSNQTTNQDQQQQSTDDIPEGYYKANAVGEDEPHVLCGESSNDNEQMAIEMKLHDLNRTCFVILNFSTKAAPFSIERLRALGWEGGDTMKGITKNEVTVRAKREHFTDQQGNAKTSMKFEIMTGKGFAFQKPMAEEQKRGFFAKLNQLASQEGAKPQAGGGYPADWDKSGPASPPKNAAPPRVDL